MVLEEIILIVVLKNVSKNRSVKKNKGDLGEICVPNNVNVCSITRDFCDLVNHRNKKNKKRNNESLGFCVSHVRFFFFPGSCPRDHVKRI